jgi:hypothetical protein
MKAAFALAALLATPAFAETLVVGDQVALRESSVQTPARGSSMSTVESRFGAPREKHGAVGEPPISRWDYEGFSVYFEKNLVIHAVVTGAAAP